MFLRIEHPELAGFRVFRPNDVHPVLLYGHQYWHPPVAGIILHCNRTRELVGQMNTSGMKLIGFIVLAAIVLTTGLGALGAS